MNTTKPVDAAFTKSLPKIEVHAHLSGSISRQCLHELWLQKRAVDPTFDLPDPWDVMPPGKVDYTLDTFFNTFGTFTYHLLTDLPSITYATTSVLNNFHADGIKYLELRTIPRPSPHFTQEAYISTILSTITTFAEKHPDLTTRLILSLDRGEHNPADADAVVNLAIAHKPLVVGVDIA
ncbi:adenosine deaminase, partial [Aspergillus arachidicola]